MVTKVYKINGMKNALLMLNHLGKNVTVRFENYESNACTCKYTTCDSFIQDAIESHPWFCNGVVFVWKTDGGEIKEAKSEDCIVDDSIVRSMPRVKSVMGAANILVTQYGVYPEDVDTKEKLLEKAKEVGVSFPNLKDK